MTTTPTFDRIIASMPDGLEKDVYCIVRDHVGKKHAITLDALTLTVFGQSAICVDDEGNEYVNPTKSRMIREAIETLREVHGVPVCSNSGKAGRYLPESRAELDEFIAEHRSRAAKEIEAANKVERAARTWDFTAPKEHIPASFEADQLALFELPKVYA